MATVTEEYYSYNGEWVPLAPPAPPAALLPPTAFAGTGTSTADVLTWIDSTTADATGYDIYWSSTPLTDWTAGTLVAAAVAPGVQTVTHTKDAAAQAIGIIYYGIATKRGAETSAWASATVVSGAVLLTYSGALNGGGSVAPVVAGAYTVSWGDGSPVESFAANAAAAHVYPTSGTFVAAINPQAGQSITTFSVGLTHSPVEIVINTPTLTVFNPKTSVVACRHLNRVDFAVLVTLGNVADLFLDMSTLTEVVGALGTSGPSCSQMFRGCSSLSRVPSMNTASVTDFRYMFRDCTVLTDIPLMDTSSGTHFHEMFRGCSALVNVPLLNTSSGVDLSYMFKGCTSLVDAPALNTASAQTLSGMFADCYFLSTVPLYNTSAVIEFGYMFENCAFLTSIPAFDMRAVAPINSNLPCNMMTYFCFSLASFGGYGSRYKIDMTATNMGAAALNAFFTNLGIADNTTTYGQQTIILFGAPGALTCDIAIAEAKGWVVFREFLASADQAQDLAAVAMDAAAKELEAFLESEGLNVGAP